MKILHLSDTHGHHRKINDLPQADVVVHSGDISNNGTEEEVLDFLNWYIELPYPHKIFVTGNHDLCLWDAEGIEDLPSNVYFLQDSGVEIDRVKFFGLAYNHSEELIPDDADIIVIHEPPVMILDESAGTQGGTQGDTQGDSQGDALDLWIEEQIRKNPNITTEELSKISKKGLATIKRHIAKLSHIKYVGSGYSGHWEIVENNA